MKTMTILTIIVEWVGCMAKLSDASVAILHTELIQEDDVNK